MKEIKQEIYNIIFYSYTTIQVVGENHNRLLKIYKSYLSHLENYKLENLITLINKLKMALLIEDILGVDLLIDLIEDTTKK